MSFDDFLHHLRQDQLSAPNVAHWQVFPARVAALRPLPPELPQLVLESLKKSGIRALYSHQAEAWDAVQRAENIVLATGTASGKTLAYNLPVLAALTENPLARALYLYPTKALAQDQLAVLKEHFTSPEQTETQSKGGSPVNPSFDCDAQTASLLRTWAPVAIYDGDTPTSRRKAVREKAQIVLSNPDMLHTGILPHHTLWAEFFRNLRFVVIDELHIYRGVFGSHVANVLRRLKRIAAFYGARPQFILTSATIGNPAELAGRLVEAPLTLIDHDGSARGEKHFLIYNPPVVDEALGLRKSSIQEAVRLATELLKAEVQAVLFARSRRSVEILLSYLQEGARYSRIDNRNSTNIQPRISNPESPISNLESPISNPQSLIYNPQSPIRGYRSGYLPAHRREIEHGLRSGAVRLVVATNALELGVDIGGLDAALLLGYPGSVASTYQQAGRSGRGALPSAAILVASPAPLDQYLAHHPEALFGRSPERGLINPDHLLILLNHIRCALFELPFSADEGFGGLPAETIQEYLQVLAAGGEAHAAPEKTFWMSDAYPAAGVSLRSASPENVILQTDEDPSTQLRPRLLGEVDRQSAPWMVHPRAVYLHEAQQYYVQELDLERGVATLIPVALDYLTEPLKETSVEVLSVAAEAGQKAWGEIQVTSRVTGFRKRAWVGGEILGQESLDLPPTDLQTTGYWLSIPDETLRTLSQAGLWTNAPNEYGPEWPKIRERVRARDGYRCQVCGRAESGRQHDVHHKTPFRFFMRRAEHPEKARAAANNLANLVTLCPECHKKAESNVRIRSGLAGLGYVLVSLAPLFLMCDAEDLGLHIEPEAFAVNGLPTLVLYDQVPAGIGFSERLFELHAELLARGLEHVRSCACEDGCPSCVGPGGENGLGGKLETLALLKQLAG
ncbi:MAG: DEAD/DEAH box helicase [Anaerolineales bacterium]|jgi:DEAD/DEAH box helicase domain-containing protein|nr:DEAD/DEAH box helicase [Anaerolineales bacterium]